MDNQETHAVAAAKAAVHAAGARCAKAIKMMPRRRVLHLVAVAVLVSLTLPWLTSILGPARTITAQEPPKLDLSGTWGYSDDEGTTGTVTIDALFADAAGKVTIFAQFTPGSSCPGGDIRSSLFYATYDTANAQQLGNGGSIAGSQFWACSYNNQFNMDCDLTDQFVTKFDAEVSRAGDTIDGRFLATG